MKVEGDERYACRVWWAWLLQFQKFYCLQVWQKIFLDYTLLCFSLGFSFCVFLLCNVFIIILCCFISCSFVLWVLSFDRLYNPLGSKNRIGSKISYNAWKPILVGVASPVLEICPFLFAFKMAKISLWTMDYSPWGSKNKIDQNRLK